MSKAKELRDEARSNLVEADRLVKEGDIEGANRAIEDAQAKSQSATDVENAEKQIKALKGEFNKPTNAIPVTTEEAKIYSPDDKGKDYKTSYRPATWVKGLPSAVQPKWVRDQMGDNEKAEEKVYKEAFTKWLRDPSPNAGHFWTKASSEEIKAMQEGTDSEGGFFVPEDFRATTVHDPGTPGGVHRPLCTVITTTLKDGYLPTMGSSSVAVIAEEAAYGDTTPTVGQVSFNIRKVGTSTKVSQELLEDSAVNLPALLSQIFSEAFGRYEDEQIINGDGTTEIQGLRAVVTDGTDSDGTSAVTIGDILTWYFDVPAQFRANATWSTTSSFLNQAHGLDVTSNKGTLFGAPVERLLGKPIVTFDGTGWDDATAIATNEEIGALYDFRNYYLIDRIGMSVKRDDSIYVANDQVGFFARRRGDGRVGLANAGRIMKIQ
jgi:HK97 family phage major capsid protein